MNNKSFIFKYSLLFALSATLVYLLYILTGRTFVTHYDGTSQHYNALIFYGQHLRNVLHTVFIDHSLNIPSYSFSIGEGGDILTTFHFYVIGAPLCALSVFFNANNMYILYTGIVIMRLYLSGLAFIYLCKTTGIKNENGILIGAISYAFCFYGFWHSTGQVFFLIPMICFPMVIAGTEKIISRGRPDVFILSVFVSAIANFYYFYMIALLTVIYVAVRLVILCGKRAKDYVRPLITLFVSALTGTLTAGIVLIPVLYTFTADARFSRDNTVRLFYPASYYLKLPDILLTPSYDYYLCLCFVPAALLAFLYLFTHKESSKTLKVLSIITLVMVLIPFFGQLLNGMSYISNRWSFAIALLSAYVLCYTTHDLCEDIHFYRKYALILPIVLAMVCLLTGNIKDPAVIRALIICLTLTVIMAFVPAKKDAPHSRGIILIIFTVLSIVFNSSFGNLLDEDYAVSQARRPSELAAVMEDDGMAAQELLSEQPEFHRYLGHDLNYNSALNHGVSSPSYYWSLTHPESIEFNADLGLIYYETHKYDNYDDRTIITDLSSVLYYITPENSAPIPYGYTNTESDIYEGHSIYINSHPLGLTFSTSNTLPESEWLDLSVASKEESLLYCAVIPDAESPYVPELHSVSTPYESSFSSPFHFVIEDTSEMYYLNFNGVNNSEIRINFEGIHFEGDEQTALVIGSSNGIVKTLYFYEDDYIYFNGRRNFTVNLGYSEESPEWIVFVFTEPGVYDFDNIDIECIPMDGLPAAIDALNEDVLENVEFGTDMITGDIDLSEDKILVFTIPYSEGWTATVDGEEYPLIRTDIKYMGLDLTAGHHDIVLKYKTPYFGSGVICSITGLGACIVLYIITRKKAAHNVK